MIVGYELGTVTAANPGAAANYIELRGNATRRVKLRELAMFSQVATAADVGFGRPAAQGVTPTTPITWLAQDPADAAGTAQTAIAWATAPTVPANFHRKWQFNNVIGSGVILTWPSDGEFILPATGVISIVIWAVGAGPTSDVYFAGGE